MAEPAVMDTGSAGAAEPVIDLDAAGPSEQTVPTEPDAASVWGVFDRAGVPRPPFAHSIDFKRLPLDLSGSLDRLPAAFADILRELLPWCLLRRDLRNTVAVTALLWQLFDDFKIRWRAGRRGAADLRAYLQRELWERAGFMRRKRDLQRLTDVSVELILGPCRGHSSKLLARLQHLHFLHASALDAERLHLDAAGCLLEMGQHAAALEALRFRLLNFPTYITHAREALVAMLQHTAWFGQLVAARDAADAEEAAAGGALAAAEGRSTDEDDGAGPAGAAEGAGAGAGPSTSGPGAALALGAPAAAGAGAGGAVVPDGGASRAFEYRRGVWARLWADAGFASAWKDAETSLRASIRQMYGSTTVVSYYLVHSYCVAGRYGDALTAAAGAVRAAPHDGDAVALLMLVRQLITETGRHVQQLEYEAGLAAGAANAFLGVKMGTSVVAKQAMAPSAAAAATPGSAARGTSARGGAGSRRGAASAAGEDHDMDVGGVGLGPDEMEALDVEMAAAEAEALDEDNSDGSGDGGDGSPPRPRGAAALLAAAAAATSAPPRQRHASAAAAAASNAAPPASAAASHRTATLAAAAPVRAPAAAAAASAATAAGADADPCATEDLHGAVQQLLAAIEADPFRAAALAGLVRSAGHCGPCAAAAARGLMLHLDVVTTGVTASPYEAEAWAELAAVLSRLAAEAEAAPLPERPPVPQQKPSSLRLRRRRLAEDGADGAAAAAEAPPRRRPPAQEAPAVGLWRRWIEPELRDRGSWWVSTAFADPPQLLWRAPVDESSWFRSGASPGAPSNAEPGEAAAAGTGTGAAAGASGSGTVQAVGGQEEGPGEVEVAALDVWRRYFPDGRTAPPDWALLRHLRDRATVAAFVLGPFNFYTQHVLYEMQLVQEALARDAAALVAARAAVRERQVRQLVRRWAADPLASWDEQPGLPTPSHRGFVLFSDLAAAGFGPEYEAAAPGAAGPSSGGAAAPLPPLPAALLQARVPVDRAALRAMAEVEVDRRLAADGGAAAAAAAAEQAAAEADVAAVGAAMEDILAAVRQSQALAARLAAAAAALKEAQALPTQPAEAAQRDRKRALLPSALLVGVPNALRPAKARRQDGTAWRRQWREAEREQAAEDDAEAAFWDPSALD
ncbi:hypothetical protein HYH03_001610 [Edaphochlamys debaryana]|uniref:Uncharacterized protein n=1 Tax=Edaphochlamys debaryana TaxID=47281 RepID=A0A835YFL4_9CHLO|nr:hypothetical protein HYH03_001610 [Edaphochlamys debaryana]|eukprot:KAG2500849.1 hypothetical protein HYH03_001610 [Edaphochlamys debaryana]